MTWRDEAIEQAARALSGYFWDYPGVGRRDGVVEKHAKDWTPLAERCVDAAARTFREHVERMRVNEGDYEDACLDLLDLLGEREASEPPICDYCGDLNWTVERYGRVTHKRQCPHRRDPWSQTYPQQESFKDQVGERAASEDEVDAAASDAVRRDPDFQVPATLDDAGEREASEPPKTEATRQAVADEMNAYIERQREREASEQ